MDSHPSHRRDPSAHEVGRAQGFLGSQGWRTETDPRGLTPLQRTPLRGFSEDWQAPLEGLLTPSADARAAAEPPPPDLLDRPPTAFMALHSAVTLCALDDGDRLIRLAIW